MLVLGCKWPLFCTLLSEFVPSLGPQLCIWLSVKKMIVTLLAKVKIWNQLILVFALLKTEKWDIFLSDRILPVYACALFQSSDAGEYKCVATNDVGISEGVAMLTVRGRGWSSVTVNRRLEVKYWTAHIKVPGLISKLCKLNCKIYWCCHLQGQKFETSRTFNLCQGQCCCSVY